MIEMILQKVRTLCVGAVLVVILFVLAGALNAEESVSDIQMPDQGTAVSLIYETLIAVNNANRTENYSVLRSLGSPDFQSKFTAEDLVESFKILRLKNVDLLPVILLKPVIQKSQFHASKKLLRLKGFMPTRPVQLNFEIQYQYHDKRWRLYILNLDFKDKAKSGAKHLVSGAPI